MKNCRIKKVTENELTKYYPQVRVLFWWNNLISASPCNGDGGFSTIKEAEQKLFDFLQKPVVEYIDFDPERDCVK